MPILREIVEEHGVLETLYAERSIYPRLEEAFDALKWRLSRTPEFGYLVDEKYWVYRQEGNLDLKIPALLVLYTFDNVQVIILFLQICVPTV